MGEIQRRAFMARVKPEAREAYVAAHAAVWPELLARYREVGFHRCSVYLAGNDLFLYVEAEDFQAAEAALENDPVESKWQRLMDPMMEVGYREMTEIFHLGPE